MIQIKFQFTSIVFLQIYFDSEKYKSAIFFAMFKYFQFKLLYFALIDILTDIEKLTKLDQLILIQAALVIRGFGIRGFDYSRMQKPRIARENCYFVPKLGLF